VKIDLRMRGAVLQSGELKVAIAFWMALIKVCIIFIYL